MIDEFCNWLWAHTPPAWNVQIVQTKDGFVSVRIRVWVRERRKRRQEQGRTKMEVTVERLWALDIIQRYRGGVREFARVCAIQLRTDMSRQLGDAEVINENVHREDRLRPGEVSP